MADSVERRAERAHTPQRADEKASIAAAVPHLRRVSASEISLYVKVKAAHWTVFGPLFREIHFLLDDIAAISIEAVDETAERISQLGGIPPLGLTDVGGLSIVKDRSAVKLSNREALEELLHDVEAVVALYRDTAKTAEEAHDVTTHDIATEFARRHEKQAWFVRQTLIRESSGQVL